MMADSPPSLTTERSGSGFHRLFNRERMDTLVENSIYGIAITAVNSVFGFAFWLLAARLYPTRAVGLATALIAAMMLVATLSNLGGGWGLVQRLPSRASAKEWSLTVNVSLLLCVLTGFVASIVTVFVLPVVSPSLAVVRTSPVYAASLCAGIILWNLSTSMDFLFVAERKVKFGFVRNAFFSLLKLPFAAVPVLLWSATALALFGSWIASLIAALLVAVQVGRRRIDRRWTWTVAGMRAEGKALVRPLLGHHLVNLGGSLPVYILPLTVTARLGVVPTAWAYIGWMVGGFGLVVSPMVAVSLFAEGSHDPAAFAVQVRRSFRIIAALFLPMMAFMIVLARPVLGVFGAEYGRHSYGVVIILVFSAIPDAITNVFVVTMRVRGRMTTAALLNIGMAVFAAGVAWIILPLVGVTGIAWAWLLAQVVGSIYAMSWVWLRRRHGRLGEASQYPRT